MPGGGFARELERWVANIYIPKVRCPPPGVFSGEALGPTLVLGGLRVRA